MRLPEKIDLHMHTTASDGTDRPSEIIERVKDEGIDLFAVTDHDGIAGALEIENILRDTKQEGLRFIKGIEFSCADAQGKYHILGYDYDAENEDLKKIVHTAHENRIRKVQARLAFLEDAFGFTFREEDIEGLMRNHNPGKPHIANLMVKYGYAESIEDAMKGYLNKKKFPSSYILPEEAIQTVLQSGGIPVLAHPCYGDGSQLIVGEEMEDRLKRLTGFGLQGVEAFYSGFTPKLIQGMLRFADDFDLYVTAGSDYHGTNKLVPLGDTNLDSVEDAPDRLKAFLRAILPEKDGCVNDNE